MRPRPLRDRREAVLLLFLHAFGGGVFNVREVFSIAQLLRIRATGAELLETQI